MNVGVIGFGRLGRLLVRHFAPSVDIKVYDKSLDKRLVRAFGAAPATLEDVCQQDMIVICVPISEFEGVIRQIKDMVRPGALVADTCSVKEHPVRVMKTLLPANVGVLGAHPAFGPDSAADSLKGRKLVLCKVRMKETLYREAKAILARKGLEVIELTPAEHDKRMASSLVLTHFIGRGLIASGAKTTGVDTEGYKRLLRILETVQNDSWQLFEDMNRFNAFAEPVRRRFLESLREADEKVRAKEKEPAAAPVAA